MDRHEVPASKNLRAASIFEVPDDCLRLVTWPEVQRIAESLAYIGDQVAAEQARIFPSRRLRSKRRLLGIGRRVKAHPEHPGHTGYGLGALLRRITAAQVPEPSPPLGA